MNENLLYKIKKLNLAGISQTMSMRIEQAAKENLSHLEFLELLIEDEYLNRSRNKRTKLMGSAHFPQHKTLEEFNFSFQPSLRRSQIYGMGTCEFIRKKENIAFIGFPGTGKTHLSIALGIKAVFLVLAVFANATMWMAVFADMGASLLVVANGLRLLRQPGQA